MSTSGYVSAKPLHVSPMGVDGRMVTYQDVAVTVAPLYVALLDLWRRIITHGGDVDNNETDIEDVAEKLDRMEEKMATEQDVNRLRALMDTLHDDAEIIHDNVIDHNPCIRQREEGDCPFCVEKAIEESVK